jgi:hypothetical protein
LAAEEFEKGSKEKGRLVLKFPKKNHVKFLELVDWLKNQIQEKPTYVEYVYLFSFFGSMMQRFMPM